MAGDDRFQQDREQDDARCVVEQAFAFDERLQILGRVGLAEECQDADGVGGGDQGPEQQGDHDRRDAPQPPDHAADQQS